MSRAKTKHPRSFARMGYIKCEKMGKKIFLKILSVCIYDIYTHTIKKKNKCPPNFPLSYINWNLKIEKKIFFFKKNRESEIFFSEIYTSQ